MYMIKHIQNITGCISIYTSWLFKSDYVFLVGKMGHFILLILLKILKQILTQIARRQNVWQCNSHRRKYRTFYSSTFQSILFTAAPKGILWAGHTPLHRYKICPFATASCIKSTAYLSRALTLTCQQVSWHSTSVFVFHLPF